MRLHELKQERERLIERAAQYIKGQQVAAWWCVSGYIDILTRTIDDIERHQRRAEKVYQDRAVKFGDEP